MAITIVGVGAIGGVIGGYMRQGGVDVQFVDIDEAHVDKMNAAGLTIEFPGGEFTVPVEAYLFNDFIAAGKRLDDVFLCVKAQHTRKAVAAFKHLLGAESCVVSFQNGLCEQIIAEEIGAARTVGCFVNLFADYLEPGRISYGGAGSVYIGEIDGAVSERVKRIVADLAPWGPAKATDNIFGYLWSKLAYASILMATALTNETIADVIEPKANQVMLFDMAAEVLAVAAAQNIVPLGFDDWNPAWAYPPEKRDWDTIEVEVARHIRRLRSYTKTHTGIWRDIAVRKRQTEVIAQMSPVIAEADRLGVDVAMIKKLVGLFMEIEAGERELSLQNLALLHDAHKAKIAAVRQNN
jgi:2-dehydropantoate 2-reductase